MTDPYLIAHKVRGLPAFDIATKLDCPECTGAGCPECDDLGYWWVIPTSGHRAYPYWHCDFDHILYTTEHYSSPVYLRGLDLTMPPSLPDHYVTRAAPKISLAEALGIRLKPTPSTPIIRRF